MIGRLRGEIIERLAQQVIVDVHGVGYLVTVSPQAELRVGSACDLFVYTAVRDDAINLFGFLSREEKELFDLLIGVPGVGPVKAMNILQTPVANVVEMVAAREPARLAKLPGVGKKTAERLLVDLADKIAALGVPTGSAASGPVKAAPAPLSGPPVLADVVSAMVNLGFKEAIAAEAAKASVDALGAEAPLDALIRDALVRSRPKV